MASGEPTGQKSRPLAEDRLRDLVTDAPGPGTRDGVREVGNAGGTKSISELAAAAVSEIEHGRRRKYSSDERPPDVVIRRSRVFTVILGTLIVVAVFAWKRALTAPPPPIPGDPVDVVAVLSPAARASAAMPLEWTSARSDTGQLGERERAVRIGALLVELERAAIRDDSTAQRYADAIAALVADVPDGAETAGLFASLPTARQLATRHALAPFARAAPMALGAWIQGARVASAAGDAGFFAGQRSRDEIRALLTMPAVSPDVAAARDLLDTLLRRRGRPDFPAVSAVLDALQRELAN